MAKTDTPHEPSLSWGAPHAAGSLSENCLAGLKMAIVHHGVPRCESSDGERGGFFIRHVLRCLYRSFGVEDHVLSESTRQRCSVAKRRLIGLRGTIHPRGMQVRVHPVSLCEVCDARANCYDYADRI